MTGKMDWEGWTESKSCIKPLYHFNFYVGFTVLECERSFVSLQLGRMTGKENPTFTVRCLSDTIIKG